jgi:hypothetical protein
MRGILPDLTRPTQIIYEWKCVGVFFDLIINGFTRLPSPNVWPSCPGGMGQRLFLRRGAAGRHHPRLSRRDGTKNAIRPAPWFN